MRIINRIFNIIQSIYKKDILYFVLLFILLSITDAYYHFINSLYLNCLYNVICAYGVSTIICFILLCINNKTIRKFLRFSILIFLLLYAIINYYSIALTLVPLDNGVISLILSTNLIETSEFIKSYISTEDIITMIIVIVGIFYISSRRLYLNTPNVVKFLSYIFIFTILIQLGIPYSRKGQPYGRIFRIFQYNRTVVFTPDLTQYKNYPNFEPTMNLHPENIVVIIGESFAKIHSSLYGYHKETNPLLQVHQKDSNLFVFHNVTSPATQTIEAFKAIMNTYSYARREKEWYECLTIPESFKTIGYKTIWISNQSQYGVHENISTRFAQLCDTVIFTQKSVFEKHYDEEIIRYLKEEPKENELFILHLWGQHSCYSERYPEKFNVFKENDYLELSSHQRKNVSEYDNATLYNDFVVDSIINIFKEKETIIFYFPDHGEDIYFSDKNYCGHGIKVNAQSDSIGKDIPLMIYTSLEFKDKFPLLIDKIQNSTNRVFNTEDIIFSLIDISGYKFKNNNDVEKYSLFTPE